MKIFEVKLHTLRSGDGAAHGASHNPMTWVAAGSPNSRLQTRCRFSQNTPAFAASIRKNRIQKYA